MLYFSIFFVAIGFFLIIASFLGNESEKKTVKNSMNFKDEDRILLNQDKDVEPIIEDENELLDYKNHFLEKEEPIFDDNINRDFDKENLSQT